MAISALPLSDLRVLDPCDTVEAWNHGHLHCRGVVEATAPIQGVVWIRDDATGCRLMLQPGMYDVVRLAAGFARVA